MQDYRIRWEIVWSAETPEDAARAAYRIMRDPDSTADYMEVFDEEGHALGGFHCRQLPEAEG